jgi:hypothetical protein
MAIAAPSILAPRFLFRFTVPVNYDAKVGLPDRQQLDESYRLVNLAALDRDSHYSEREFANVRMAWSGLGVGLHLIVSGKRQPVWCRDSRLEDSDGLQVWIDTRATHNIHRASKFCHRFVFLPAGGGRGNEPLADQLLINRARENARPVRPRELQVRSRMTADGYELFALITAEALGGYDPEYHRQLGFTYAVRDRELGMQTFATGPGLPFDEDPSCWATLELTK